MLKVAYLNEKLRTIKVAYLIEKGARSKLLTWLKRAHLILYSDSLNMPT